MDYNGRIYQLVCDDGFYYIGSTKNELRKRLYQHKKASRTQGDRKVYKHINNIGWDRVKIVLIEEYKCRNKEELVRKEYEYIQAKRLDKMCMNVCGTVDVDEYKRQYNQNNKEKLKIQASNYYLKNKELILQKNKEYRNKHADKIKAKEKEWYHQNKEIANQKVSCECGSIVSKSHIARHKTSTKHIQLLNNKP